MSAADGDSYGSSNPFRPSLIVLNSSLDQNTSARDRPESASRMILLTSPVVLPASESNTIESFRPVRDA